MPRLFALFLLGATAAFAAQPPVSFNRDIRPIMADTCFHCHGFDAATRKAGMRLDLREEALRPTKQGFIPIVPGKPEESEVWLRVSDEGDPMPPADAHKVLTTAQKDLLRRWIAEGARYEPHWAYAPLVRPAVPAAAPHPVDAFIRAKLAAKGLEPSPEADRATLLRRLSLDLTGLPPTPEETAAFLADASPGAYEQQVERLLGSVHHGERMAVWWLDIARFADTVGFHGDQNQRIFPYRDYVINAFNGNKRFDQFTIEQLAGDLLPSPTVEQRVATGYNRLNMMTREGGAQPAEYLAKYGAERVRSVAAAWFGSTFGCAECHDHKFDPILSRDFYELQSFFADVRQWGVYSDYGYTRNPELGGFTNDHPFPPELEVDSPYLARRRDRAEQELADYVRSLGRRTGSADADARREAWVGSIRAFLASNPSGWETPSPAAVLTKGSQPLADRTAATTADGSVRADRALARGESLRLTLDPATRTVASIRLELTGELPGGALEKVRARDSLTLAAAVRSASGKERKLAFAFAEATAKVDRYRDGQELDGIVAGWKLPATRPEGPLAGVWLLTAPATLAPGETLVLTLTGEATVPLRAGVSPLAAGDPLAVAGAEVRAALLAPRPSPAEQAQVVQAWLFSSGEDRPAVERHHRLAAALRATRGGRAPTLVTEAASPLTVRVLPRGNWQDESGPVVLPATPSFLPGRLESTPERRLNRLDLARWLVSDANPLTARTVANRLWALYFGTGLSATLDDLGSQGEPPSHPELLDWLATELRGSGWDLRHLIRVVVTSATYRQSSRPRPALREADPANRLLAAQSPRRLEAEFIRDQALHAAGLLDLAETGGPSVKPYQPEGYYAALQFPDRTYVPDGPDGQWRRGVYVHWQRTFLHPMLANFDAPARDECAAQRVVSNTPQQALTLLNDPTFVEAARGLAARLLAAPGDDAARLRRAFQLTLARDPRPEEAAPLLAFLGRQRDEYRARLGDAARLGRTGLAPATPGDPAEAAAWTSLARVLLNLHEVITRT